MPLPSEAEPAVMDVDLRDGLDLGNTSASTSPGKVVGDSIGIAKLIDLELYGLRFIAGSTTSWVSLVADLKGLATSTSKTRYGNSGTQ